MRKFILLIGIIFHYSLSVAQHVTVTPAADRPLYAECGNLVKVEVTGVSENYFPPMRVSGGMIIGTATRGEVIIVPHKAASVITLTILFDSTAASVNYKVVQPPLPTVQISCDSSALSSGQTIKVYRSTELNVKLVADKDFARLYPKDAKYLITEWTIVLIRNQKRIRTEIVAGVNSYKLSDMNVKKGDRICVKVITVKRSNFQGRTFEVKLREEEKVFEVQ